jgi:hypothetical protein
LEEGLLRAAREALRPLARRLLEGGIPFGRLEGRLRELYVELADEEFALPGRRQTDSRVSLLTGINRKEVRRIRSADPSLGAPKTFSRNLAASVVSEWLADARATDRSGRPRPVPYQARRGPSFVAFVRRATADLPPRAILDELVRTGAAERREGDVIALTADAYVPALGEEEKLEMLADDPAELIGTMLHNIFSSEEALRLQRKVSYDNVGSEGLAKARAQLRREAERFLRKVNRILAAQDRDRNPKAPGGERCTAGLGVYYFESPARASRDSKTVRHRNAGGRER